MYKVKALCRAVLTILFIMACAQMFLYIASLGTWSSDLIMSITKFFLTVPVGEFLLIAMGILALWPTARRPRSNNRIRKAQVNVRTKQ